MTFENAPLACGFRDQEGPTHLAWGSEPHYSSGTSGLALDFRDFHLPEHRSTSLWRAFPSMDHWRLENHQTLDFPAEKLAGLSLGNLVAEEPSQKEWQKFCEQIENGVAAGAFRKIVPARSRRFSLSPKISARLRRELLPRLFSGPSQGTFRFFLKNRDTYFFGATPELLFRKSGNSIFVPAIAGTRPLSLEAELLANSKELLEHDMVVVGIRDSLKKLGLDCDPSPPPTLLRLRSLAHLYTPIQARGAVSAEQLLLALHPTPAVGGLPKLAAEEFLRRGEPLDRGLFASPMLFRAQGLELCLVAIRSALLEGDRLHFFAGAGYVAGSRWENEWGETGKKMDSLALLLEEERS